MSPTTTWDKSLVRFPDYTAKWKEVKRGAIVETVALILPRRFAPQLVEEVQQEGDVRGRFRRDTLRRGQHHESLAIGHHVEIVISASISGGTPELPVRPRSRLIRFKNVAAPDRV